LVSGETVYPPLPLVLVGACVGLVVDTRR
jgi:hypothetical protein